MVTAEVQDETHQTIAANVAIPAHHAGVYFGIDRGSPIGAANGARDDQASSPSTRRETGSPANGTFKVRAPRLDLRLGGVGLSRQLPLREEGRRGDAPGGRRVAPRRPRRSASRRRARASTSSIVEGKDGAGNADGRRDVLWTRGATATRSWQADDNERFDVIADKPSYKVGETARLLLKTTVRNATGLLTIERDGVIEKRPVHGRRGHQHHRGADQGGLRAQRLRVGDAGQGAHRQGRARHARSSAWG